MTKILSILFAVAVAYLAATHLHAIFVVLFILGVAATGFLVQQSTGDSANSHCNYEAAAATWAIGSGILTAVFGLLAWIS